LRLNDPTLFGNNLEHTQQPQIDIWKSHGMWV